MMRSLYCFFIALSLLAPSGCSSQPGTKLKYQIAVVPKGMTHEFWKSIERGARRAAQDLTSQGIATHILWDGPRKESDIQDQIRIVQQMTGSRGIQGLVLAPQDSKALVPVVKETADRGIPVVIIDSGLEDTASIVKYVATDNYQGGRLAGRRLLEVLEKDGKNAPKLALLRYQVGSESTEQREKGFLDEVQDQVSRKKKEGKPFPEIISDNVYSGATVDTAQAAAGPLLIKIRDQVDGIFAVNESAATGMINAMRSQGLNKKIMLVGFDSSEPLLQAVEEGDVSGLIVQDPYRMGYMAVWVLVQHLEGKKLPGEGKNLSTGEYLLTRDNLKEQATRERFDPQLQEKRTIQMPLTKGS